MVGSVKLKRPKKILIRLDMESEQFSIVESSSQEKEKIKQKLFTELDALSKQEEGAQTQFRKEVKKIDTINTLLRKHSVTSIKDLQMVRDEFASKVDSTESIDCLLYTSPSPRDATLSRKPSSA